jgi:hypothetical protein
MTTVARTGFSETVGLDADGGGTAGAVNWIANEPPFGGIDCPVEAVVVN